MCDVQNIDLIYNTPKRFSYRGRKDNQCHLFKSRFMAVIAFLKDADLCFTSHYEFNAGNESYWLPGRFAYNCLDSGAITIESQENRLKIIKYQMLLYRYVNQIYDMICEPIDNNIKDFCVTDLTMDCIGCIRELRNKDRYYLRIKK